MQVYLGNLCCSWGKDFEKHTYLDLAGIICTFYLNHTPWISAILCLHGWFVVGIQCANLSVSFLSEVPLSTGMLFSAISRNAFWWPLSALSIRHNEWKLNLKKIPLTSTVTGNVVSVEWAVFLCKEIDILQNAFVLLVTFLHLCFYWMTSSVWIWDFPQLCGRYVTRGRTNAREVIVLDFENRI